MPAATHGRLSAWQLHYGMAIELEGVFESAYEAQVFGRPTKRAHHAVTV